MTQTIAPRVRTLVLLLLAATGLLLAGAGPVSAHAALTGSDPQQGAVVDKAPTQVSLTFSEGVALSNDSLRVLDPKGKRIDRGDPAGVSGTTYAVKLHSGLPDGTYTVTYQVVSEDSHPVAGAYTFSIGAPSQTTVSVSGQEAGAVSSAGSTGSVGTCRTPDSSSWSAAPPLCSPAGSAGRACGRCSGSSSPDGWP